jgi:CDP-diacylglycerol--glycerol-3-phosphate 3-phosphatidyltransferase
MPPLLPSFVSLLRLPLAAAFILLKDPVARVVILGLAAATDFLDGRLARSLRQGTRFGELVDPFADKIFALTTVLTLAFEGALSFWQLGVLLARDIATSIAFLIAMAAQAPIRFKARMSGKVTTTFQIGTVLALTLRSPLAGALLALTALASLWAIADYARFGAVSLRQAGRAQQTHSPTRGSSEAGGRM